MDNGLPKYYSSWRFTQYEIIDRNTGHKVDTADGFQEAREKEAEWNRKDREARGIKSNEIEISTTYVSSRNREKIEVAPVPKHGAIGSNLPIVAAETDTDYDPGDD